MRYRCIDLITAGRCLFGGVWCLHLMVWIVANDEGACMQSTIKNKKQRKISCEGEYLCTVSINLSINQSSYCNMQDIS